MGDGLANAFIDTLEILVVVASFAQRLATSLSKVTLYLAVNLMGCEVPSWAFSGHYMSAVH